jgi:muramidase (phage lysozyme)
MSGSASNIRIVISAVNLSGPALTQAARNVNTLGQATQGVGRTLQGLGNTAPINRGAQAMGAYGSQTLAAARAMERLVTPMGLLTASGSIAGIVSLTKNWADAGNAISKTALPLSMSAESLSEWQIAARLAGASTGQLDQSMSGLSDALSDAHWGRNAALAGLLRSLNIEFDGLGGKARTAEDALGDVSRAMYKMRGDPGAQARFADAIHIDRDLIPMLLRLEEFHARARRTNGAMTTQMVENSIKLRSSWEEFGATFEGVTNRIVDGWSGGVTKALDASSKWIQSNQETADSYAKIATGIIGAAATLRAARLAPWMLRALGLGFLGPVGAAIAGEEMLYYGTRIGPAGPSQEEENRLIDEETGRRRPRAGPRPENLPAAGPNPARTIGPPAGTATTSSATIASLTGLAGSSYADLIGRGEGGYNSVNRGAAGGNAAGTEDLENKTLAEVMSDQAAQKYNAAGHYQIIRTTLADAAREMGLKGDEKFNKALQDRIFEGYLTTTKRPEIAAYLSGRSNDLTSAVRATSYEWASVADPDTGLSHYAGVGNNRASISIAEISETLRRTRAQRLAGGGDRRMLTAAETQGTPRTPGPDGVVPGGSGGPLPPPTLEVPPPGTIPLPPSGVRPRRCSPAWRPARHPRGRHWHRGRHRYPAKGRNPDAGKSMTRQPTRVLPESAQPGDAVQAKGRPERGRPSRKLNQGLGVDAEGVWAWIDNYCRANPIKNIGDAAAAFYLAHPR